MRTGVVVVVLLGLAGCDAHQLMRGSVVMKVSDTEAHVCLGKGEVHEGEPVRVYRNICRPAGVKVPCHRQAEGSGTVERVLNDHYSVVKFAPATAFEEGDTVEALGVK